MQIVCLGHDVFTRKIAITLFQNLKHRLAEAVRDNIVIVALVGTGHVLVHESAPFVHAGIVGPGRVRGIFDERSADDADAIICPGGIHHRADGNRDIRHEEHGLPGQVMHLADRLSRHLRQCRDDQNVVSGRLQRRQLTIDCRIRRLIRRDGDHLVELIAENVLHAQEVILTEIVVLIEQRDFGVRFLFQNVFRVNLRLGAITGLPSDRPGIVLVIAPLIGAGGQKQMRHFLLVHIAHDRAVGGRAQGGEAEGDVVLLDQAADLLHRFRRTVGVVERDVVDLMPGDAALFVHHAEERGLQLAKHAIGRCRAAVGAGVADLDLGRGNAGRVRRSRRAGRQSHGQRGGGH